MALKTQIILGVLLALPVAALSPMALADGVGASGQCYDDDDATNPSGGQDEVRVDTVTGPEVGLDPVPGNHGITDALVKFASGTVEDGGQTGTACDRYDCFATQQACNDAGMDARFDYLEVDVKVGNTQAQVCYRGAVSIAGDCPRHPTGPGA